MRQIFYKILALVAKMFLARYKPRVIGITGSVGKTSAKEAIATVLRSRFRIRQSQGNYNNEIGLPLAILGEQSAGKSVTGWFLVFIKSFFRLIATNYPQILVLEMGADKPGDIAYLTGIVGKIDVGVISYIGNSHMEFFSSQQDLVREKLTLIKKIIPPGKAVLNFDSPKVYDGRNQTKADVIGYGFANTAALMASDLHLIQSGNTWGVNFKVHHQGNVVPFFIPDSLGAPTVYAALAAVGVGLALGINLIQSSEALKFYLPPPGRLRVLAGIKRTMIIDDTYNAAPASTVAALDVLKQVAIGRKVAAIGSMAELGSENESGHREVAAKIMEVNPDVLFLVGENAKIIKTELEKRKYSGRIHWYPTSDTARMDVQNTILEGDMILIKGSQSARMEKIVKEIMADPMNAEKLLVRQSAKWM